MFSCFHLQRTCFLSLAPVPEVAEEAKVVVEENPTVLFYKNQLRGFHSVLAGLEACDQDVCHGGKTLPLAVGRTIKRLDKLKGTLREVDLSVDDRNSLMARLGSYSLRAEALPQEEGP